MKTIKSLTLALLLVVPASGAFSQSGDFLKLMNDLESGDGVTSVLVTKKMFGLFARTMASSEEGESLNEILGNLDELKVIELTGGNKPKRDLRSEVSAILKRDRFEPLMKVVEDGEFVEISVQESGGKIRHLVMYIEEDGREIQLISITGIIDLDQISKLSGTLNIEGLELIEGK